MDQLYVTNQLINPFILTAYNRLLQYFVANNMLALSLKIEKITLMNTYWQKGFE